MSESIGQVADRITGDLNKWVRVRSQGKLYRVHPDRMAGVKDGRIPIKDVPPGSMAILLYDRMPMLVEVL